MNQGILRVLMLCEIVFMCIPAYAGQVDDCAAFLKLTDRERKIYLDGYTLGAAMELKYLRLNVVGSPARKLLAGPDVNISIDELDLRGVVRKAVDYVDEKYSLVNIAASYKDEFNKAVVSECKIPDNLGLNMFDILPTTLERMKATGRYPVYGM